jgi:hypothetical protein
MFIFAFLSFPYFSPHTDEVSLAVMLGTHAGSALFESLSGTGPTDWGCSWFSPGRRRVLPRLDHGLDPLSRSYLCIKLNGVKSHKTAIFIDHNRFLSLSPSLSEARIIRYFVIRFRCQSLKMEAVGASEIFITFCQTTRCFISEDSNFICLNRFRSLSLSLCL